MKAIALHALPVIFQRQRQMPRHLRHRAMKRVVKAGVVRALREDLLRLADQRQRRRNVQRGKMHRRLQLAQYLWRDELMIAQLWSAVDDAMPDRDRRRIFLLTQRSGNFFERGRLRLKNVFLLEDGFAIGRLYLETAAGASDPLSAAFQHQLFVMAFAVDAELQRRRPAVQHEDQISRAFTGTTRTRHLFCPNPVTNLFLVDTFGMGIRDAVDDLVLQPVFDMRRRRLQLRHPVDDIDA